MLWFMIYVFVALSYLQGVVFQGTHNRVLRYRAWYDLSIVNDIG